MNSALAFVILILSSFSAFATVYHSDGSAINVQYIHNTQAVDGDTITLPSGTFIWSGGVNVTKAITIQENTTVNSDTGVCNDLTKIVDNVPRPNGSIFACRNTSSTQVVRITGITFTGAGGSPAMNYHGIVRFYGGGIKNRIDHCHFTGHLAELNFITVYGSASGPTYGVADHLVMDGFEGSQTGQQLAENGTRRYGDAEWTQPVGFGGPNFFFMEDCYLNNSDGMNTVGGGWDSATGGRYVIRHCHLYNVELLNHGTESSGRIRGGRGYELYNNDYHWSYQTTMDGIRSGSMIAHDNTFVGFKPRGFGLQTYRMFCSFDPWGGASGDNPWDVNDPVLYGSGTTTAGDFQSLTDTTKNWTTNQWVGFVFKRLSDGQVGYVVSNDSHTVTVFTFGAPWYSWGAGQAYQIHRVPSVALDQVCRGRGDLIMGVTPINATTGTLAWPHQDIEPCYSWNNVYSPDGSTVNFVVEVNPPLQAGRDYFSNTPMPGYTPYTYPHPLVIGSTTPSSPVANPATFVASNSFKANWRSVSGATGYRLDVVTNNSFTNYVAGYQNLNIGNALSRSVTGLNASTTYYYRVRAYNGNGTSGNSNVVDVTTLSPTGPPVAITNLATLVARYSAKLNGSVNPHGLSTTVYFQYGRTTSYGNRTPNQTKTGINYQNVSANISGLSAHTTYHFRIVASNTAGTRYGTDRILTTQ